MKKMGELSCIKMNTIATMRNIEYDVRKKIMDTPLYSFISEFTPPERLLIQYYYAINDLVEKFQDVNNLIMSKLRISMISYTWNIRTSNYEIKSLVCTFKLIKIYINMFDLVKMAEGILKPMKKIDEINYMAKELMETMIYLQEQFENEFSNVVERSRKIWDKMKKHPPILKGKI
jgi:hypothetical protein